MPICTGRRRRVIEKEHVMIEKTKRAAKPRAKTGKREVAGAAVGAAVGAAAGAAVGAIAGPPGIAVGAAIGTAVGALAEGAVDRDKQARSRHDATLDQEIGVTGGDMGASNLRHPPARIGAYSDASAGARGRGKRTPAEGPIPEPDED
jgi:hypothetical protein